MDSRDRARMMGSWYDNFDQSRMIVEVTLYDHDTDEEFSAEFPVEFEVCHLCNGKGKHVNPSIDAHGISAYEFHEDPDFAQDYFSGMYDEPCYECRGQRVVPEICEKSLNDEQKKNHELLRDKQRDDAMYAAEREYEMRMGY